MAAKRSRVPSALGSIPLVGGLAKQADSQAQWLQDLLEQNTRMVAQLPETLRSFNDSLERFNQTVERLDRMVTRVESATDRVLKPVDELGPQLDRIREVPELIDALRSEALPALLAATTTQKQVALLTSTMDRVLDVVGDLPGAGLMRRFADLRGDLLHGTDPPAKTSPKLP